MAFWVPQRISDNRFRLPASQAGCVGVPGRYAMMGGVTSAAVITAMEEIAGRQLLWSTTQFISHAPAEVDFDIQVSLLAEGGRITQAQGSLYDGDRLVLQTSAALGEISDEIGNQYCEPRARTAPESCSAKETGPPVEPGGLLDQFERRVAQQSDEAGFESLWFRLKDARLNEERPVSAGLLAVLGDFLPGAVSPTRGASSVDNTLRINRLESCEWMLAETSIQAIRDRLYQGVMNIFSESGALLAVASQTGIRPKVLSEEESL